MKKEKILNQLLRILKSIGLSLFVVMFVFDRLIISFVFYYDMPGLKELLQFKHEQERFKRRFGIYATVFICYLIFKLFTLIF